MFGNHTSNVTFGIEIETLLNVGPPSTETSRKLLRQVEPGLNTKLQWDVGIDNSCSPGLEFRTVGGIQATQQNLELLRQDIGSISQLVGQFNPETNRGCGTHIHVGGLSEEQKTSLKQVWLGGIQKYLKLFLNKERFDSLPGNTFVKPVSSMNDYGGYKPSNFLTRIIGSLLGKKENLQKFLTLADRGSTMEFRAAQGSLNPDRVALWVDMAVNLAVAAPYLKTHGGSILDTLHQDRAAVRKQVVSKNETVMRFRDWFYS